MVGNNLWMEIAEFYNDGSDSGQKNDEPKAAPQAQRTRFVAMNECTYQSTKIER